MKRSKETIKIPIVSSIKSKCSEIIIQKGTSMTSNTLFIADNEVHIYFASVNLARPYIDDLRKNLIDEEKQKALKFVFEKDRVRYTIARGILREILGQYLSAVPNEISFSSNKYGKLSIDRKYHQSNLNFNLSHSGDMIVYGIINDRQIGIDVENIRPNDSSRNIINRFCSGHEKDEFNMLPERIKERAFFTCWTRKEAYIKALGLGLYYPLEHFSVSLTPGKRAKLTYDKNYDVSKWSLEEFISTDQYIGAVAVEGKDLDINLFQWEHKLPNIEKIRRHAA